MQRCVIIGASPETDVDFIRRAVRDDDFVVCADGGYVFAEKAGIKPGLLIGDFDSSEYPDGCGCEIKLLPVMKDDTDTMSCIRECLDRGYRDFVLLGMTGGRTDHTFANYSALLFIAQHGGRGTIMDKNSSISVIACKNGIDELMHIAEKNGCGFAVFPFGCESCTVTLKGFLYKAENTVLHADFPMGTSNTVISESACVILHSGNAIVMVYAPQ